MTRCHKLFINPTIRDFFFFWKLFLDGHHNLLNTYNYLKKSILIIKVKKVDCCFGETLCINYGIYNKYMYWNVLKFIIYNILSYNRNLKLVKVIFKSRFSLSDTLGSLTFFAFLPCVAFLKDWHFTAIPRLCIYWPVINAIQAYIFIRWFWSIRFLGFPNLCGFNGIWRPSYSGSWRSNFVQIQLLELFYIIVKLRILKHHDKVHFMVVVIFPANIHLKIERENRHTA